jgi:hypothetical protein
MAHHCVRLPLIAALLLSAGAFAAEPPSPFSSKEEISAFLQGYHENPQPERIEAAMRFVAGSEVMTNDNTNLMAQASFSCLFARYPERKPAFRQSIASLEEPARTYFQKAIDADPADLFLQVPAQPKKNDMSWGCYFVTGDVSYAQDVIAALKNLSERQDLLKYLTASSAQWSLSGIARDDAKVRAALEQAAKSSKNQVVAAAAREALEKPPGAIRAATIEVIKAQKAAGVWK